MDAEHLDEAEWARHVATAEASHGDDASVIAALERCQPALLGALARERARARGGRLGRSRSRG